MSGTSQTGRQHRPARKPAPSVNGARVWFDLMETCEQLLLAGFRRKVGPEGDLSSAYRAWSDRHSKRRDGEIAHMLSRPRRPGPSNAV